MNSRYFRFQQQPSRKMHVVAAQQELKFRYKKTDSVASFSLLFYSTMTSNSFILRANFKSVIYAREAMFR